MVILLQSLRDQFSSLYMGLHGGIYDGWGKRFFLSYMCAPAARGSWLATRSMLRWQRFSIKEIEATDLQKYEGVERRG